MQIEHGAHLIVIGNGMAGMRTVQELEALAPGRHRITVIGAEPHLNYDRIALSSALWGPHPGTVTWAGLAYNLLWVTIGNILAGAGLMSVGYWFMSRPAAVPDATARSLVDAAE